PQLLARTLSDDPELNPETTSFLNLLAAWCIGLLVAIEGTLSVPSLLGYVESLGGDKHLYGLSAGCFAMARLLFMGLYGCWVDRRSYKEVFTVSLGASVVASLLYAAAPTLGLWALLASRAALGATAAQTVATQAFVVQNTSLADRTHYMGIFVLLSNTLTLAGPALNLFIVWLPHFELHLGPMVLVFNNFTWVGYFLMLLQLISLLFVVAAFNEPARRPSPRPPSLGRVGDCLTLWGLFPYMRLFVDPWIRHTGAWFIFVLNFRNAFTLMAVNFAVPVITSRDYGWTQLHNSYIFVALSLESIISTAILQRASRRVNDRNLMSIWAAISHSGLFAYSVCSGFGTSSLSVAALISLLVWYDFGTSMPPTQSLYSKLIGKGNAGLYFSVLLSNGSLANAVSGQLVGSAYGSLGPPALWGLVQVIWILSWIVQVFMWRRLHPEYIREMHMKLNRESHPATGSMSLQAM
ncbi:mfsd8, partial [Symbiodinium pilosum]